LKIGNLGGGSPLAKIAALLAMPPAESALHLQHFVPLSPLLLHISPN
jgi:hypothetical protein